MLIHNTRLSKFIGIKIIQSISFDHKVVKLEINIKKI